MKLARPKSSIDPRPQSTEASTTPSFTSLRSSNTDTKPQYIVKKVETEDVFEDSLKRNYAGLSQINEENTGDLDELQLLQAKAEKLEAADPSKATKNIFKLGMVNSTKYKEYAKGPLFEDEKVVKHSIVGSVDTFEFWDRHLKRNIGKDSRGVYLDRGTATDASLIRPTRPSTASIYEEPSSFDSRRPGTQTNSFARKLNVIEEKRKNFNYDVKMDQEELVTEIEKIKERQSVLSSAESKRPKSGTLAQRLYLSKDERNLEKFEKVNNQWQRTIDNLNHKVQRDGGASVMVTLENYREKKELTNMLELVKTDEEKYGSRIWYSTLRKAGRKSATGGKLRPGEEEESVPERLKRLQNEFSVSTMEVIRKPTVIKTVPELNKKSDVSHSRSEKQYLDSKLVARKQDLNGIMPLNSADVDDLIVVGKNKLDLESRAILKKAKSNEPVKVPKAFLERKGPEELEQTIERNKTNSQVLKHGLGSFIL